MNAPDLKEIIMNALKEQRDTLLISIKYSDCIQTHEDFVSEVFSEHDLLDESLSTLGITWEDIDPNDFRDYQHETVELCIEKQNEIKGRQ